MIIAREEARTKGLKRFFTGEPCKHGHIAERAVLDGKCLPCRLAIMRRTRWRQQKLPYPTRAEPTHCECCGKPSPVGGKMLCLDHDHITGAFRGWLCLRCNSSIGALGDSIAGLEQAIAYLKRALC